MRDWVTHLPWAWQMTAMFAVIVAALLAAVFANDALEYLRWRRHRVPVERRRP